MHEFKHGELKSGAGGKAGKVKSRRQATAIALKEAGASKYESESENKRNLAKSERKEARADTYQQEREEKGATGGDGSRCFPIVIYNAGCSGSHVQLQPRVERKLTGGSAAE